MYTAKGFFGVLLEIEYGFIKDCRVQQPEIDVTLK